ncbi:lipopolysaccharide assembly protein LapB [Rufibacter sp. XAAS-G3-1]|uniref:tetratricopeptide repeat protein n=1 Tax=Rufibacter sp. XAAS-G3-1 TaxID=2729134 RepID=UPI0015E7C2D3|nr:tetratricopeptide repeat protein [Rufibacter sp. XAAS-G3-1]
MTKNWKTYGVLAAAFFTAAGASAHNNELRSGEIELTQSVIQSTQAQVAFASYAVQDNAAASLVKQGKAALEQNKVAEAQQLFDKALSLTKNKDNNIKIMIGEAYVTSGVKDLTPAIKVLEEATSKDTKNANAFVLLGDAYLHNKTVDGGKAMANYDKALAADSKFAKAHLRKGQLYVQSRNFTQAKEALDAALAADPNYAPTYLELAELYYRAEQYEKSSEYIKKYVSMAENTPETRAKYASILYLTKDYANAMTEIQSVLKSDPNNIAMNRLLAYTYYDTKQYDKALEAITAYFNKYDESKRIPSDYEYYANTLVENKKPQEAIAVIEQAKKVDPKNPLYNDLLAKQYLSLKDYPKAIEAYKAKFAVSPPNNTDLFYYGYTHELNDDYKTADSVYTIITKSNPTYAYGHFWRARVNSNLDPETKEGLAKPHYEEFIKLTAGDKEKYKRDLITANNYLGYYYYTKKDKANATKYWQEVKTLDPANADATNGLNGLKAMK